MSIERVVVILTPAFAALAGWVTSSVSQLVPGVNLNKGDVTAIFVTGAAAAVSAAIKWLHGRQKLASDVADLDKLADTVVTKIKASGAAPALADIELALKSHENNIIQAIGTAVHASPSVDQVVEAMAQRLTGQPASPLAPVPPAA